MAEHITIWRKNKYANVHLGENDHERVEEEKPRRCLLCGEILPDNLEDYCMECRGDAFSNDVAIVKL